MTRIIHSKPNITIFADASFYQDQKVCGWGGWASGDERDAVTRGGPGPRVFCSTEAEFWALALMIETIQDDGYLRQSDQSVILQSDSLNVLSAINRGMENSYVSRKKPGGADIFRAKAIRGEYSEPLSRIKDVLRSRQVVYLRHVKGHQKGVHSRSWVNEQCDKRAKREARLQLRESVA